LTQQGLEQNHRVRIDAQTRKSCKSELRLLDVQHRGFKFEPAVPSQSCTFEPFGLLTSNQGDEIECSIKREPSHFLRCDLSGKEVALLDSAGESS
jgi:hypothetical protein